MDSHDDQTHDAIDKPAKKITAPQGGVSGQRADGTLTATIRMLTARAMLRHGGDPAVVATTTRVPQALVEVMADMADTPYPSKFPTQDLRTMWWAARRASSRCTRR